MSQLTTLSGNRGGGEDEEENKDKTKKMPAFIHIFQYLANQQPNQGIQEGGEKMRRKMKTQTKKKITYMHIFTADGPMTN